MSTATSPPLPALNRLRCWTHPAREAAARCPACTRFFCRECVTEHDGRFLCAGCLRAALAVGGEETARRWRQVGHALGRAGALGLSVGALWGFFTLCGRVLAHLPAAFHEGTLWKP